MDTNKPDMPVIFLGHGNPMHALGDGQWQQGWRSIAQSLATQPKAVACISAHWMTKGTQVHSSPNPRTIHDFGGFPQELFAVQYPAPGAPAEARQAMELIRAAGFPTDLDETWGFDHGAWAVLKHMYPRADVPIFQISLDRSFTAGQFLELGKVLAPLRQQGILLVGSGNVAHNLALASFSPKVPTQNWVIEFMDWVADKLDAGDAQALGKYHETPAGRTAVNSGEHYYPFLVTAGAALGYDLNNYQLPKPDVFNAGFELGSISMHSYVWR